MFAGAKARTETATERIKFIKLSLDYLEPLAQINLDPDVMRYIDGKPRPYEATIEWLHRRIGSWTENGFGIYVFLDKKTGEFLGRGGLVQLDGAGEIEVGYALKKSVWGQGLATEAAHKIVEIAFSDLKLSRVYGTVWPENVASENVLRKIGMTYIGERPYRETVAKFFQLKNPLSVP